MQVKVYKALWGLTEATELEDQLKLIKGAGYEGVEAPPPEVEPERFNDLAGRYGLGYVAMAFAETPEQFRAQVEHAKRFNPALINCHSGLDRMSFEDGCNYFLEATKIEGDLGVTVAHETHRHRLFYSPWSTRPYLEEFPTLKVCADFSHWCVVCESLLQDMEDMVELACSRTVHIHARVGYEEGPQVPDPRAPEYAPHVERHMQWWAKIKAEREAEGAEVLTVTPEFGPPGYLHTLPYTNVPVANLWDICLWMAYRLRERLVA
jgi:sugar phosphate isomerase/epimerase